MTWFERHPIRKDSKSISLLAVFTAMVVASQVSPIPGITYVKTGISGMNLDWTGIPIVVIFEGLGVAYSFFSVAVMWISIGYRNFIGAIFKTLAESLMLLGMTVAWLLVARRTKRRIVKLGIYLVFGCAFRAVGMFFANAALLPIFYPYTPQTAYAISVLIVPWNVVQAVINIAGGFAFYSLIPSRLAAEAGLGDGAYAQSKRVIELDSEEERRNVS
jgi:riboflavin transporter FmnP